MADNTNLDPFSRVYTALWSLLEASQTLTTLVPVGNRIRYDVDNDRSPTKGQKITADMPQLELAPSGGVSEVDYTIGNSGEVKAARHYVLRIATGEQAASKMLWKLEWAVMKALVPWRTTFKDITLSGADFVQQIRLTQDVEGLSKTLADQQIKGWVQLLTIEVEMTFTLTEEM
jgi:hypothetical protein